MGPLLSYLTQRIGLIVIEILSLRQKLLRFIILAATPLEASSGTLNVWFYGSSLYDTYLRCVEISLRKKNDKQTDQHTSCYFIIRIIKHPFCK